MSVDHTTIFPDQKDHTDPTDDASQLGPHLQNPEIIRLLQEILDLRRQLKTAALKALRPKTESHTSGSALFGADAFDKMMKAERVRDGINTYEVSATKGLIILIKTQAVRLLRGLIELHLKMERVVIRRKMASMISWNGNKEGEIKEPLSERELIAILTEYKKALLKSLDKAKKSA